MPDEKPPNPWRKRIYTCLGCLAVDVGLVVLILVSLFVSARGVPGERVTRETSQPIPRPASNASTSDAPGSKPKRRDLDGTVELHVRQSDVRLFIGPPGCPVSVEANYDKANFTLTESLREETDSPWRYRLTFGPTVEPLLFRLGRDEDNELRVTLPPDARIALRCHVRMGETTGDLGRADLELLELANEVGPVRLRFGAPTARPMSSLSVRNEWGGIMMTGIGNASPAQVSLSTRFGRLVADMEGAWTNGADVRARMHVGQLELKVPGNVPVRLDRAHVDFGEVLGDRLFEEAPAVEAGQALVIDADGAFGSLQLQR